jgi:hypothetical protein
MRKNVVANLIAAALGLIAYPLLADEPPVRVPRVLNAVSFPPVLSAYDPEGTAFLVLAPNETNVTVVFDASLSYNPEGQPLRFIWGTIDEQFYPLPGTDWSTSPYLTNVFRANTTRRFYLVASEVDREGSGFISSRFTVGTRSPSWVMAAIRDKIRDKFDNPNSGVQRLLLPIVDRAAQQFRDGDFSGAIETVKKFQRTVKRRLQISHPHFTKVLVSLSQAVIDTVTAGQ